MAVSCSQFPGGSHKLNKVVVVVNGGGNSGVVVVPLSLGEFSIVVFVTKVGEEFEESLILSNLSRNNFWVRSGGVDGSEISSGDKTRSIKVELAESSVNDTLSWS